MLLDGSHQLETAEGVPEVRFVERLHGVEAHYLCGDSFFPELVGRLNGLRQHISGRQQAYILAVGYSNGPADLEVFDRTRMHHRLTLLPHADIDRTVLLHCG